MLSKLNLGKGEVEAINLCFEIKAPLLLIDEKKGRNIAQSYKLSAWIYQKIMVKLSF